MALSPIYADTHVPEVQEFIEQWRIWHTEREEYLSAPYSWLSLTGIYWLSSSEPYRIHDIPGVWSLNDSQVTFDPEGTADAFDENGHRITSITRLRSDRDTQPSAIQIGSIRIELILRDGNYALRTKDPQSAIRAEFTGIDYFEPDPTWNVPARAEIFTAPREVENEAVIPGILHHSLSIGNIVVTIDGHEYPLAVSWSDHLGNMILFHDTTNGISTYGGGRAIVLNTSDLNSIESIDFNRAFNLPCAYSPYCTCPIATNRLDIPVTAGEKVRPH